MFIIGFILGFLVCAWLCADLLRHKGLFTEDWKIINLREGSPTIAAPDAAIVRPSQLDEVKTIIVEDAAGSASPPRR